MIQEIKEFISTLSEEMKYSTDIISHKKSLEATLWGLEEQSRFPENSAKNDQEELSIQINNCRIKISNCNKLISAHDLKLKQFILSFSEVLK